MSFILGALGSVLILTAFTAGAALSRLLWGRRGAAPTPPPKPPSRLDLDAVEREARAEREALRQLRSYSAETAYGLYADSLGDALGSPDGGVTPGSVPGNGAAVPEEGLRENQSKERGRGR